MNIYDQWKWRFTALGLIRCGEDLGMLLVSWSRSFFGVCQWSDIDDT
jgi:hypothetical protein